MPARNRILAKKHLRRKTGFILFLLAVVVYSNSLDNDYIYDDVHIIKNSSHMRRADGIGRILRTSYWSPKEKNFGVYRPLTLITFWINRRIFGDSPFSFHLVNVLLYGLNVYLVFLLIRRWTGKFRLSAIAATLFALHPIHTEVVNLIVGRAELLGLIFFTVSLLIYDTFHRRRLHIARKGTLLYPAALFFFLLGLLSKETTMALLLLLPLWHIRRPGGNGLAVVGLHSDGVISALGRFTRFHGIYYAGFWVTFMFYMLLRFVATGIHLNVPTMPYVNTLRLLPFYEAQLTALKVVWKYVVLLVFPKNLSLDYSYNQIRSVDSLFAPVVLGGVVVLLALAFLMIYTRRRNRVLYLSAILFATTFLPFSNLFFRITTVMAERLMYLPSIGFVLLIAYSADKGMRYLRFGRLKYVPTALLIVIALAYTYRTWGRSGELQNALTAFRAGTQISPRSMQMRYNLAHEYQKRGELRAAEREFRNALSILPDFEIAQAALANVLVDQGRFDEAESILQHVVLRFPTFYEGCHDLGVFYAERKRLRESLAVNERCMDMMPLKPEIYFNMTNVLLQLGRKQEAEHIVLRGLRLHPESDRGRVLLALIRLNGGRLDEARGLLLEALQINPRHKGARRLLRDIQRRRLPRD